MKRLFFTLLIMVFVCGAGFADTLYVVWNDAGNMDRTRPSTITVQVDGVSVSVAPDADGLWKQTVTGTVIPPDVENYTRRDTISRDSEITLIYDHTPILTGRRVGNIMQVEVNVIKNWVGVPTSVAHPDVDIDLLADGVVKETKVLPTTGTVVFSDLPMYEGLDSIDPIVYSVEEVLHGNWVKISDNEWISLDGLTKYTASVSWVDRNWEITNTFSWMQDKVDIPVEKIWKDEGTRPESVVLGLFCGDVKVAETVIRGDSWKGKFADLPLRDESGAIIDYGSCVVKEKSGDNWVGNNGVVAFDGKSYVFRE